MIRIGFIGTGNFARQHAQVLQELGANIVGCFGTNNQKTARFSSDFNCKIYSEPLDLISKDIIDALYIVIPPFAHDGAVEFKAIENDIPFLCEKPVGLDLALCQSIANAINDKDLITSSGYLLRYEPLFSSLKKIIERNFISTIRACSYMYMPDVHWWRKMDTSGGMMIESGSHYIDLLRFLFGEIQSVTAIASKGLAIKKYPDCDIPDSMESIFTFTSGQIGSLGITHILNSIKARNDWLEMYGDNFALHVDLYKLRYEGEAEALYKEHHHSDWIRIANQTSKTMLLKLESTAFLESIKTDNKSPIMSTYPDAVITLQAALAMNESSINHLQKTLILP